MAESRTRRTAAKSSEPPEAKALRVKLAQMDNPRLRVTEVFSYPHASRKRPGVTVRRPIMASIYQERMFNTVIAAAAASGNLHLLQVVEG